MRHLEVSGLGNDATNRYWSKLKIYAIVELVNLAMGVIV